MKSYSKEILRYISDKYNYLSDILVIRNSRYYRVPKMLKTGDVNDTEEVLMNYNQFGIRILDYCGLTMQEYYDLMLLHINSEEDRPKCKICGNPVSFKNVKNGYKKLCCKSCQVKYKNRLSKDLLREEMRDNNNKWKSLPFEDSRSFRRTSIKSRRSDFIRRNSGKICYFYLAKWNDKFKYGISSSRTRVKGYRTDVKILFESNAENIANLEANIKYHFRGYEWCKIEKLNKFYDLFSKYTKSLPIDFLNF